MKKTLLALVVVSTIATLAGVLFLMEGSVPIEKNIIQDFGKKTIVQKTLENSSGVAVTKFVSDEDFFNYLSLMPQNNSGAFYGNQMMRELAVPTIAISKDVMVGAPASTGVSESSGDGSGGRYSSTNVQVFGIDEPDIVKTDGNNIFLSQNWFPIYYARPMMIRAETDSAYPYRNYQGEVKVIKANPATDLKLLRKIDTSGNLLLSGNVLMVFYGNTVKGYDVSASGTEKELWKITYPENDVLVGARLYGGKLYLATQQTINFNRPCPYQPFVTASDVKIIIPCNSIYHPITPMQINILYTVSIFNTKTGAVQNSVSFAGSGDLSQLYMSPNAVYVTYYNQTDNIKLTYNFLKENKDLVPSEIINRMEKLLSYELSYNAKQTEMYYIMNVWQSGMDKDEQLKNQNEIRNRMEKYLQVNLRELESTTIVKTSIDEFKVIGTAAVPGRLLNQFSLDEFNKNLRLAVTIGQGWASIGGVGAQTESISDVYVLGEKMEMLGSVKDLGKDEQIYSARFIGDKGYVVTFKQVDPFYVIDLSNPKQPKLAGELKIPGYSSYLEPISEDIILGVGKEDNQVKLALFDVSDPNNPKETSKFILDEYWSEALSNHHAFLKDEKHSVFFIPGSNGGYVFSYTGNQLSLKKAVSETGIQRALYINDVLYIVSQNKLSAWDEKDWTKISEIELIENKGESVPVIY